MMMLTIPDHCIALFKVLKDASQREKKNIKNIKEARKEVVSIP